MTESQSRRQALRPVLVPSASAAQQQPLQAPQQQRVPTVTEESQSEFENIDMDDEEREIVPVIVSRELLDIR